LGVIVVKLISVPVVALVCLVALTACGGAGPTPTPTFPKYTAEQVMAKIQPLGVSNVAQGARVSGDQSPNTAIDSRTFTIATIAPKGGQLLLFDTPADRAGMEAWYARFPDLAPYVYVKGNALLQLNSGLSKAEAEKFREALNTLP
jgi:predicted small lipoprotein YifL